MNHLIELLLKLIILLFKKSSILSLMTINKLNNLNKNNKINKIYQKKMKMNLLECIIIQLFKIKVLLIHRWRVKCASYNIKYNNKLKNIKNLLKYKNYFKNQVLFTSIKKCNIIHRQVIHFQILSNLMNFGQIQLYILVKTMIQKDF